MQTYSKLEFLPNELFIECFQYLNGADIFYSFYHLNHRFDRLIHNIPLQLNFEYIRKTKFDQFCKIMLLNPEIRKQVYSLKLSNHGTCSQIDVFTSLFSLDEFSSLRSLTLTGVEKNNFEKLKIMLPKSCSIHIIEPDDELKGELPIRSLRRIETLPATLECHLPLIFELSSITNLTISRCTCHDVSQLISYLSMLKYLNVRGIFNGYSWTNSYQGFSNEHAVHLKQLILLDFSEDFNQFEQLIKQTPSLKRLMISTSCSEDLLNVVRWKDLIASALPLLTVFKFEFSSNHRNKVHNLNLDMFTNCQSDFWQEQHHWHTGYLYHPYKPAIYTIHYALNPANYSDFSNKVEVLDNITYLTVPLLDIREQCQYHLRNVTTLRLKGSDRLKKENDNNLLKKQFFQSLGMLINLSKLKHLDLSEVSQLDMSLLLLELFKEAPQLYSLEIVPSNLTLLFGNDELCNYLNKMIKHFSLTRFSTLFINDKVTEEFCKIFSNIEQLSCKLKEPRYLLTLLKRLTKLSILKVYFSSSGCPIDLSSIKDEIHKLNGLFHIECTRHAFAPKSSYITTLTIWMDKDMK